MACTSVSAGRAAFSSPFPTTRGLVTGCVIQTQSLRPGLFTTLVWELELWAFGTKHPARREVYVGRNTTRRGRPDVGVPEVWPLSLFFLVSAPWSPFPPWPLQPFPWGWSGQILSVPQNPNAQRLPTALVGISQRMGPGQQLCATSSERLPTRCTAQPRV